LVPEAAALASDTKYLIGVTGSAQPESFALMALLHLIQRYLRSRVRCRSNGWYGLGRLLLFE
jgi:hypothetical protein